MYLRGVCGVADLRVGDDIGGVDPGKAFWETGGAKSLGRCGGTAICPSGSIFSWLLDLGSQISSMDSSITPSFHTVVFPSKLFVQLEAERDDAAQEGP